MRRLAILTGLFALALAGGTSTASASPILMLQQGSQIVFGTQTGDLVMFNGTVGAYDINASVGISNSTDSSVEMHLNSFNVTLKNTSVDPVGGSLTVTLGDTNFLLPSKLGDDLRVFGTIGGVLPTDTSVTFQSWVNPGNAGLGSDGSIPTGSVAVFSPALSLTNSGGINDAFSSAGDVSFNQSGMFSLFSQATFNVGDFSTIGGVRAISFDQDLFVPVPEPFSITLLGSGLAGLFAMRRRKVQA